MDATAIVVASIAALGAVLSAWFSRKAAKQSKTTNGATTGVLVETIAHDMDGVRDDMQEVSRDMKQMRVWLIDHLRDHAKKEF